MHSKRLFGHGSVLTNVYAEPDRPGDDDAAGEPDARR